MKISYNKEGDVLYVKFNNKKIYRTKEIGEDFIVDVDKNGAVVGVEILDYSTQKPQQKAFQVSAGKQKIAIPV